MSPVALLSRRNTIILNVVNRWRKVHIAAGEAAVKPINNHNSNNRFLDSQLQGTLSNFRTYQTFKAMDAPKNVFSGVTDRFGGVTVDGKQETNLDHTQFKEKLQKSLDYWLANKKRAIWFRVYKEQADWVPILAASGFDFHHARTGVVIMYRWLPTDESSNLPHYAHTLLGVGGLVINEKNEVLVVSDRHAIMANMWKLPGGYVEPNENLVDAVVREVEEETGVRTTFTSMICMRHSHSGNFGCSDIYIVMGLKPINLDLTPCSREIERVRWMPLDEYFVNPEVLETNRLVARTYLDNRKRGVDFTCANMVHQVLKKEYQLYFVKEEESNK